MNTVDAAAAYIRRGFAPVPIPRGEKGPRLRDWTAFRTSPDTIARDFAPNGNVGIILGASQLCDVDLDCAEAVEIGAMRLPTTGAIFGRAGRGASHYLYRADGAKVAFVDPLMTGKDATIIELRCGPHQTMAPPSIHPCGEVVSWICDGEPATVDYKDLRAAVETIAAAVLVVRYGDGTHNLVDIDTWPAAVRNAPEIIRARVAEWLGKTTPRVEPLSERAKQKERGNGATHAGDEFSYIRAALDHIDADDRDTWLKVGGALHDSGHSWGRILWDDWSRRSAKFDARDQDDTWASYRRSTGRKAGIGTIVALAQANGFADKKNDYRADRPHGNAPNDDVRPDEPEHVRRDFDERIHVEQPEPNRDVPEPLEIIRFSEYVGAIIPERQFVVQRQIPCGVCTILSGDGGLGKSILMQMLQTALAIGGEWCGIPCDQLTSFAIYCEDDKDELLRRQKSINAFYGIDDANGRLLYNAPAVSRIGKDNLLMVFDSRGRAEKTRFFQQLREQVLDEKHKLLGLDCLVELFGGDEIKRPQVRQFMSALNGLAHEIGGAVLLNAHPSAAGLSSGSGTSGSTDWNNAARSRLYLAIPKPEKDGAEPDEDARILTRKKANYAKRGEIIELRYHNGVFVMDQSDQTEKSAFRPTSEKVFLDLLDKFAAQSRRVSHKPRAATYAPDAFSKDGGRQGYRKADFEGAMSRLFDSRKIRIQEEGPPSRRYEFILRT